MAIITTNMTIDEIEAASMISLIDAFAEFKKGGALIYFLEECKKSGLIEDDKFSEGDFKKLMSFRKKLKKLVREAEKIRS